MGGGGKGGQQTTTQSMPPFLEPYVKRNLERAEEAQQIGYMPYYGPDIAAFNPTQQAAFSANIGAAEAFGLVPQGSLTAMQGMAPEPQTFAGGLQAYSSGSLFDQALAELEARRGGQVAQYNKLFVDPQTGDPSALSQAQNQQVASNAVGTIAPRMGHFTPSNLPGGANNRPLPYGWQPLAPDSPYLIKADIGPSPKANTNYGYSPDTGWELIS